MELVTLLVEVAKIFGPSIAFLIYFIYRDGRREDRLALRLDEMQKEHTESLKGVIKEANVAMTKMAGAVNEATNAHREHTSVMRQLSVKLKVLPSES